MSNTEVPLESPVPDRWEEGSVDVDGVRLHYTRTGGDGPPLVVAHGVFDDGPCRTPLVRTLEGDYDVIAFDARGHGRSDAPDAGYGVADRVADLTGLIDALDLTDAILLGHSMGGDTVLATAAAHPDLPRAVVAVDPACLLAHNEERRDENDESGVDEDGDGDDPAAGVRDQILWWHDHSKAELFEADEGIAGHAAAGDRDLASLLADARLRVSPNIAAVFEEGWLDPAERFPEITAPTLILRADVDERARDLDRERVDLIDDARLVHVDGAGHCVFRDRRETATRELRAFLDEV